MSLVRLKNTRRRPVVIILDQKVYKGTFGARRQPKFAHSPSVTLHAGEHADLHKTVLDLSQVKHLRRDGALRVLPAMDATKPQNAEAAPEAVPEEDTKTSSSKKSKKKA